MFIHIMWFVIDSVIFHPKPENLRREVSRGKQNFRKIKDDQNQKQVTPLKLNISKRKYDRENPELGPKKSEKRRRTQ